MPKSKSSKFPKRTKKMPSQPATKRGIKMKPKKTVKNSSAKSGVLLLQSRPKFSKLTAGLLTGGLALVGIYIIYSSRAAVPPPSSGGYFSTLTPGSALPSEADCAARVHHSAWEPRTENNTANQTTPTSVSIPGYTMANGGVDDRSRTLANRVTGNFKGTTDEIIQWAACKWGFSDEIVRATATHESWWKQAALGDIINDQSKCQTGYTAPCPQSFGLLQVKATKHPGTFPVSRDSTAFSLDYSLMYRRVCFEGYTTWLKSYYPNYGAGDEWGCVGQWNSGGWYDAAAQNYISNVQGYFNTKPWLGWADQSITDATPPSQPTNLTSPSKTANSINLTWTASTDNVGVTGYDVYRNSVKVTTVGTTSYSDTGLSAGTAYSYYIIARDAGGNISPASASFNATTSAAPPPPTADTTAPAVNITSPASGAIIGNSTTIQASASDNVGVTKMEIYIDGNRKTSTSNSSITYSWSSRKAARGAHTITVKAYDAAGNVGQKSISVNK